MRVTEEYADEKKIERTKGWSTDMVKAWQCHMDDKSRAGSPIIKRAAPELLHYQSVVWMMRALWNPAVGSYPATFGYFSAASMATAKIRAGEQGFAHVLFEACPYAGRSKESEASTVQITDILTPLVPINPEPLTRPPTPSRPRNRKVLTRTLTGRRSMFRMVTGTNPTR